MRIRNNLVLYWFSMERCDLNMSEKMFIKTPSLLYIFLDKTCYDLKNGQTRRSIGGGK